MRVINSFKTYQIVRRETLYPPTKTSTMRRDNTLHLIVESLVRSRELRFHRETPLNELKSSTEFVVKLEKELRGKGFSQMHRILAVVQWYEEFCSGLCGKYLGDRYIPWIEGGSGLYKKFSRLEAIMQDRTGQSITSTLDEVVTGLFNGSTVLATTFRSEILVSARQLNFGEIPEAELAAKLGDVYNQIRNSRHGTIPPGAPGPIDLLRRYVTWLSEKDWLMTARVLNTNSPAFQQFRREEAERHPRGMDPLTGR